MRTMLKVNDVSISYKIGDFKDIGLKEWTMRHLKGQYHVETFLAVNHVSFELNEGRCWELSVLTAPASPPY